MRGRVVDLEPLDPASHGDSLFEATCGPGRDDLWLYLSKGPFEDRPSFDGYLRQLSSSADLSCFAIVDRRSRKAFGWAQFMRIEPAHRVIEVGNVVFSPSLRRTTGATEAVYMMARHAFDELGYRRLEWKCNALNAASRRAALRFGFRFEGVFRQHMISKGRSRDTAWFSIIDPEWPERKRSFELWLDPSNFDELGHQRTSLSSLNGAWTARGAPP
ncbi:MAG: GNAT family N-acetyltransferase [Nitrososphaerota archaeon]|nr:GNAT family N-acetyltransferase [Nitrososphaerota archaeon]MDG6978290.1 GNAT family N-acetyltransferase [Nitrososphaerota archaeon]